MLQQRPTTYLHLIFKVSIGICKNGLLQSFAGLGNPAKLISTSEREYSSTNRALLHAILITSTPSFLTFKNHDDAHFSRAALSFFRWSAAMVVVPRRTRASSVHLSPAASHRLMQWDLEGLLCAKKEAKDAKEETAIVDIFCGRSAGNDTFRKGEKKSKYALSSLARRVSRVVRDAPIIFWTLKSREINLFFFLAADAKADSLSIIIVAHSSSSYFSVFLSLSLSHEQLELSGNTHCTPRLHVYDIHILNERSYLLNESKALRFEISPDSFSRARARSFFLS